MGLIKCPDCEREISATAVSCPNCGRPISPGVMLKPATPVTIEATSKSYKGSMAVGVLGILGAVVLLMLGATEIGVIMGLLGFALYIGARLGAWWGNG